MMALQLVVIGVLVVRNADAWRHASGYAATAIVTPRRHDFTTNSSDQLRVLEWGEGVLLLGGRNTLYNVTVDDEGRFEVAGTVQWGSTDAHRELCTLKGKQEDDCQNYIRIYADVTPNKALVCGTNSYKPMCRYYSKPLDGVVVGESEEAQGRSPYSPTHSSAYTWANGQLFSGTVADFSGADPLIYREHQRTEQYDVKQLHQPAFVSATAYNEYVFFVFREVAMEHMNCGKAVFSRIGRVCRSDRGGPAIFYDRWTSFLKARLNCSLPGNVPFYFDHVVATSGVVSLEADDVIYGVFQTPPTSIDGSAVCAFRMKDVLKAFEGPFKAQKDTRSNWLPVHPTSPPTDPRPGACVEDSRTLPSSTVNFVKTHPLMEAAIPALYGEPLLVTTGTALQLTSVAVVTSVGVDGRSYNLVFAGTADGRVVKFYSRVKEVGGTLETVVVWEAQVLSVGRRVEQLHAVGRRHLVAVTRDSVVSIEQVACSNWSSCMACVSARDPECGWDEGMGVCVQGGGMSAIQGAWQEVCTEENWVEERVVTRGTVSSVGRDPQSGFLAMEGGGANATCPEVGVASVFSAQTMAIALVAVVGVALAVGGLVGVVVGHKCRLECPLVGGAPMEHRNHLTWSKARHSKDVNLLMNAQHFAVPPPFEHTPPPRRKIDNLGLVDLDKDRRHESKNSTESLEKEAQHFKMDTLQKVKKTYI
uniref:Putative semaphorin n=1 Tax=Phlebotomus kandelakii TaxID=1109342 RepID=A0A6B2EHB7_9DIPT